MTKQRLSQNKKIIQYIRDHGSITSMEAYEQLHVTRLASRMFDIKRMGYEVNCEMVTGKSLDGSPSRFGRYTING